MRWECQAHGSEPATGDGPLDCCDRPHGRAQRRTYGRLHVHPRAFAGHREDARFARRPHGYARDAGAGPHVTRPALLDQTTFPPPASLRGAAASPPRRRSPPRHPCRRRASVHLAPRARPAPRRHVPARHGAACADARRPRLRARRSPTSSVRSRLPCAAFRTTEPHPARRCQSVARRATGPTHPRSPDCTPSRRLSPPLIPYRSTCAPSIMASADDPAPRRAPLRAANRPTRRRPGAAARAAAPARAAG